MLLTLNAKGPGVLCWSWCQQMKLVGPLAVADEVSTHHFAQRTAQKKLTHLRRGRHRGFVWEEASTRQSSINDHSLWTIPILHQNSWCLPTPQIVGLGTLMTTSWTYGLWLLDHSLLEPHSSCKAGVLLRWLAASKGSSIFQINGVHLTWFAYSIGTRIKLIKCIYCTINGIYRKYPMHRPHMEPFRAVSSNKVYRSCPNESLRA